MPSLRGVTVAIYLDDAEEWRWRLRARNGRILADSGEGYARKAHAVAMAAALFPSLPVAVRDTGNGRRGGR